jgi:ketosteroid isomerase-like protein
MANEATIERFYRAFRDLDADTMTACYAEDARFEDAVFQLQGRREIGGMWGMLCAAVKARGRDEWRLEYSQIHAEGDRGTAHWEPTYRFSATGRLVHNVIDASFEFRGGLIARQTDRFDFWRWSRQALGPVGYLLGWSPILQGKVRQQAAKNLATHLARLP